MCEPSKARLPVLPLVLSAGAAGLFWAALAASAPYLMAGALVCAAVLLPVAGLTRRAARLSVVSWRSGGWQVPAREARARAALLRSRAPLAADQRAALPAAAPRGTIRLDARDYERIGR